MDALGKAIVVTKSVDWLRLGKAVPFTHKWDGWLAEAERAANACSHRPADVDNYLWKRNGSQKESIIWSMPPVDSWTARGSWDKINGCVDDVHEHIHDDGDEPTVGASRASSTRDA